ncbi:MAG: PAS domain-containing protein [Rhodanobacter sp.]|nr:MAG: PAS domain-containing protein [Rhodanobacter sp.]TAM37577.1 MAG: PAS domain-containing protein [Rhodanobacter sp.]
MSHCQCVPLDSMGMSTPDAPSSLPPDAATSPAAPTVLTVERFSHLVERIYDAALDPALWSACLDEIREELGGNYVSLIVRHVTEDDPGLIVSVASDHGPIDPSTVGIAASPFTDVPIGQLVTESDLMSPAEWKASAYYREWCAPHDVCHVMAANLGTRAGSVYGFRVTRPESWRPFSPLRIETARRLLPHLRQALDAYLSVNRDRKLSLLYGRAMAQLMVGAVVLDERGKVVECNAAASGILGLHDGLRLAGEQLEATYANDNRKLQQLIRNALARSNSAQAELTEAMSVSRPSGQQSWGLVVQAVSPDEWTEGKHRPSVAVFVRDTEGKAHPPIRLTQQLFQLTPAETALAIQLANGLSLEEAAEALNIRRNTARAHLRSIFSKTGVRRQTELVRLFLNSVAWLGSTPE